MTDDEQMQALIALLDERCWYCKNSSADREFCQYCNGAGYTLTPAGNAMLDFIARHSASIHERQEKGNY